MEQKIQELTEKIFREGVERGEEKAKDIIKEAQENAARILTEARAQADQVLADAQKKSEELRRNTESEIRLSSSQAIASVKQQLLDLISASVIDESVSRVLSEPSTIKEYVSTIIENWKASSNEAPVFEVLLPVQKQAEMQKAFEKSMSDLLKKGVNVQFSKNIKGGFKIGPSSGRFKISLTDDDFKEFFKEYLRPRTRQFLFGE
jgi:V/A-type H+/Na+-transporting ATPase subunit E